MSHNQMSPHALGLMAEGLASNTRLTDLFFTHNDLKAGEEAGLAFIRALSNKKDLRSLALNSCNLNGEYLTELRNAIEAQTELRELYLFANKISPQGANDISGILKKKSKITTLGLSNNKLDSTGAVELAERGLVGKQNLVKLSIENNGIGNRGLEAIAKALKECRSI